MHLNRAVQVMRSKL